MPIAAAPPPLPSVDQSANVSDSDPDLDPEELGDDEEYEEIEIEEEIEVEEEVSEEEQVEEEEDPEEVKEEEEEEEEEEEGVEQEEEVQEEEDPEEEDFGEDLSPIDEDAGKGEISHMDDDIKAPLLNNEKLNADPINPLDVSVKEVTAAVSVSLVDGFNEEVNDILYPKDQNKRKAVQNGDETRKMEPRSDVFIRPSSLSPGLKIKETNKRPAVICDFFTKGWCIKGNSCRFLHVRDQKEDSSQQKEGSEASANLKSLTESDEGLIEGADESGFTGVSDAGALERIPPCDKKEKSSWKSESSKLHDQDNSSIVYLKAVERESLSHNRYLDRCNSPVSTNNLFHGTFSSSSAQYSDIHGGVKVSSYATSTSQLTAGISQSNHSSAGFRQPFSFSSSWSTDPLGRHLDDGKEMGNSVSASLYQSSSRLNGSESENLSRSHVAGDTLCSTEYRTTFSSSDWEPSVPFRPSFPITQSLLSLVSQYDPIRDSIEQPNIGAKFSRFSSSSQEIMREHFHPNVNTALTGTFSQDLSSNKLSHASPQNICESTVEKNGPGNYLFTSKAETAGIAAYEQENETILAKEDKLPTSAHDREITKASEWDFLLQKDGSRHSETKVDGHSQKNEVDFDLKGNVSMQRESRESKIFRGALIDFVKELVKPTWREGNLSKDAHKVIVKKTVDKVLSSLPPDQTPSTPEDVEMYLCLSRPKIAKVVEAYVDKYGKF